MSMDTSRVLLIVEDDLALQKQLKWSLDRFDSVCAHDRESALVAARRSAPAVVTMDLGLPPDPDSVSEGFALLSDLISLNADIKVIVLTGQNDQANALRAVANGAYDFLPKPVDPQALNLTVQRAFRVFAWQSENRRREAFRQPGAMAGLVTGDPAMLRVCRTVEKIAPSLATVLLLGESGTGKEVIARGLHESSPRRRNKFVAINCAAIPENLLESELFGYEKGAFTGAVKTTPGRIEAAHGGTLMLDEIGDLPFPLQAKLLRFLQERVIERVGGRTEIPVDVRIVCATHQDISAKTKDGTFREDLFYRLAEIVIRIPPLRERPGDAALLAHLFLSRFVEEQGRAALSLGDGALAAIEQHDWPGNVRELSSCIRRAVIMADGAQITVADLELGKDSVVSGTESLDLRFARDEAEKRVVVSALGRANGNVQKAAELLGVSRPTLYDLLHRFGLK